MAEVFSCTHQTQKEKRPQQAGKTWDGKKYKKLNVAPTVPLKWKMVMNKTCVFYYNIFKEYNMYMYVTKKRFLPWVDVETPIISYSFFQQKIQTNKMLV